VTYTGNGGANNVVNHALAASIGMLVIKRTDDTGNWSVFVKESGGNYSYWNSSGTGTGQGLNGTGAATGTNYSGFNAYLTTTSFNAAQIDGSNNINANGASFVAYVFASNAGGFGLTGTDNVISCGSFDANLGEVINLGYEPQWLLYKDSSSVSNWRIADTMRGLTNLSGTNAQTIQQLSPNTSSAESANSGPVLTSTGFTWNQSGGGNKHIYIAIRRGPMKVPTSGTSVFSPNVATSGTVTTNFPVSMQILSDKGSSNAILNQQFVDRLRGASSTTTQQGVYLLSSSTAAESSTYPYSSKQWSNTGFGVPQNYEGASSLYLSFQRAPSFFDEVCYLGTGSATTQAHNLGAVPELVIWKRRSSTSDWRVWQSSFSVNDGLYLNYNFAKDTDSNVQTAIPTATVLNLATGAYTNASGSTYVAYLFATCAGVSKVGSYTGNGSSQTINCGFTGGARFVLVKATSTTGNWIVADSARGIVAGNDPALYLNSTAAEVTGLDWIDADNSGFVVNETATIAANTNGVSYIFLAIA
jgi:hypothetical protein